MKKFTYLKYFMFFLFGAATGVFTDLGIVSIGFWVLLAIVVIIGHLPNDRSED